MTQPLVANLRWKREPRIGANVELFSPVRGSLYHDGHTVYARTAMRYGKAKGWFWYAQGPGLTSANTQYQVVETEREAREEAQAYVAAQLSLHAAV